MSQKDTLEYKTLMESAQSDPEVQNQIGRCFLYGKGVAPDRAAAEKWISCAAEQGHAGANKLLKIVQEKNDARGDILDPQTLPDWCLAAEQGDPEAQYQVGKWFLQSKDTIEEGKHYLDLAVEQGHPQACLELAEQMMEEAQYSRAVELLRNAAAFKNEEDLERIIGLFDKLK